MGSSFKRDLKEKHLGFKSTHALKNRSIDYVVKDITVKKITISVAKPMGRTRPKEIQRSDTLSKRSAISDDRVSILASLLFGTYPRGCIGYRTHTQSIAKAGYSHAGEMLVDILGLWPRRDI